VPQAERLAELAERLVELDAKLPKFLGGEAQPADAGECVELAWLCQQPHKLLYTASARFYADAFAVDPTLAADPRNGNRYNAAWAAGYAALGAGKDGGYLDDKGRARLRPQALATSTFVPANPEWAYASKERARLRRRALDWLRADLAAWRALLAQSPDKVRLVIRERMRHWQQGPFPHEGNVMGEQAESERRDWAKLWHEVEDLCHHAGGTSGK
jgi:hypothetical protein